MKKHVTISISLAAFVALTVGLFSWFSGPARGTNAVTVFSASSVAWVLRENEALIEERTGIDIVIVEAASSTLARQIEEGAPADVFITADAVWLDYLDGLYDGESVVLARNRLVFALAPPAANYCNVQFFAPPNADHLLGVCPYDGKVATGDPAYVPLGKYASEAIGHYGWALDLIPASDARAALALMESGAVDAGLLYRTDVLASSSGIAGYDVPADAHDPILYWGAALKQSNSTATKNFLDFLKSEDFKTILEDKGFEVDQ